MNFKEIADPFTTVSEVSVQLGLEDGAADKSGIEGIANMIHTTLYRGDVDKSGVAVRIIVLNASEDDWMEIEYYRNLQEKLLEMCGGKQSFSSLVESENQFLFF